jgi:hypothetical protein
MVKRPQHKLLRILSSHCTCRSSFQAKTFPPAYSSLNPPPPLLPRDLLQLPILSSSMSISFLPSVFSLKVCVLCDCKHRKHTWRWPSFSTVHCSLYLSLCQHTNTDTNVWNINKHARMHTHIHAHQWMLVLSFKHRLICYNWSRDTDTRLSMQVPESETSQQQ